MDEKLLPVGEPIVESSEPFPQVVITETTPETPKETLPEAPKAALPGVPSQKQQQWGVVISIVIIMLMIIVGAFYAWGQRIAQNQALTAPAAAQ